MTVTELNEVDSILRHLKHYLPSQAPLKDFIHHNTLHAFQEDNFFDAVSKANQIFGYQTLLPLNEYRKLYHEGKIDKRILERCIIQRKGKDELDIFMYKLVSADISDTSNQRIGVLRKSWKLFYNINLDALIHPLLIRILSSYLDQGISIWNFPAGNQGLLGALRELEKNVYIHILKTDKARKLILDEKVTLSDLLEIVVGNQEYYEQYIFDQQFAHQGWSGMVSYIEDHPESCIDKKIVSLHDLIFIELLLEIDQLTNKLGDDWLPVSKIIKIKPDPLFHDIPFTVKDEILSIWQEAFEWTYYDQILEGFTIEQNNFPHNDERQKNFQALLCIDDRECSFRRYLEKYDMTCETFGTPGFFGVEFYFQPEHGKHYTKMCPAPVTPKFLIKEQGAKMQWGKDLHYDKQTHLFLGGWIIGQTLGFWSALKLFVNIFKPTLSPASASSFRHMDREAKLTIEFNPLQPIHEHLQIGFKVNEMVDRVEGVLKSIGLVNHFAPIVYVVGHGASSVNNTHYAGYDCGACSGRPGSVNARVLSYMANHKEVRTQLKGRGINIPDNTIFIGALHDTTRDEIDFYDENTLLSSHQNLHELNKQTFQKALVSNAKERSRRFENYALNEDDEIVYEKMKKRSVSLFEPRPELNHATNTLCIVGRRSLTDHLFLDRRAFMNSYDYRVDPEGKYLLAILRAAAPVCGGINLEYFFSRVDHYRLGAGTKLPHNVIGLFGVSNGVDGDLRPGLPTQMIELHDPVRLLFVVEHHPDIVMKTIQSHPETFQWFNKNWVHLVVSDPVSRELNIWKEDHFEIYQPMDHQPKHINDIHSYISSSRNNLPLAVIEN